MCAFVKGACLTNIRQEVTDKKRKRKSVVSGEQSIRTA